MKYLRVEEKAADMMMSSKDEDEERWNRGRAKSEIINKYFD